MRYFVQDTICDTLAAAQHVADQRDVQAIDAVNEDGTPCGCLIRLAQDKRWLFYCSDNDDDCVGN